MLLKVKSYITQHKLFDKSDQLALAISGGKDSVYAAHILNEMERPFILVHVNFQLRGNESSEDQQFVSELATRLEYCEALFVKKVDTKAFQKAQKVNTQEAARQLRYDYFDELYDKKVFTKLITAHHGTDNLETFFINLYRTSGLQGLRGIPNKRSYVIRPFLGVSGKEIIDSLESNNLEFREDSSNADSKYLRNTIRNKITPAISQELPDFEERALKSMEYLNEEAEFIGAVLEETAQNCVRKDHSDSIMKIVKSSILSYPQSHLILYRILDKYGFNRDQCKQIVDACARESGKTFRSKEAEVLVDREFIYVSTITKAISKAYIIEYQNIGSTHHMPLEIRRSESNVFPKSHFEELVQLNSSLFPLTVRSWQKGDRIQPLGMKGSKLLSDFFIDEKVDVFTKENLMLLCKGDEVLWVPGHRISERIKVKEHTNLYHLTYGI